MKKFFTLLAVACLATINALAAVVTPVTLDDAVANGTVVNLCINGQYLYGPSNQTIKMGTADEASAETNAVIGYKVEKDGDAYLFRCVTPKGGDYSLWGANPCYLNSQPAGGDQVTFNLGKNQDIAGGSSWTLEADGSLKNVGSGLYINGSTVSATPAVVTFANIKADPEPEPDPIVIPAGLQSLIDNKTVFMLKSGANFMYGPDNQNIKIGSYAEAAASTHVQGYVLEADEYYFYFRPVKADGSGVNIFGNSNCYLNMNGGTVIFNLGKDQDIKKGSSWIIEETANGYTIKSACKNTYLAINGTSGTMTETPDYTWTFFTGGEEINYTFDVAIDITDEEYNLLATKDIEAQPVSVLWYKDAADLSIPAIAIGAYSIDAMTIVGAEVEEEDYRADGGPCVSTVRYYASNPDITFNTPAGPVKPTSVHVKGTYQLAVNDPYLGDMPTTCSISVEMKFADGKQVYISMSPTVAAEELPLPTAIENAEKATAKAGKFMQNGKLVIVKNGKTYNAAGQLVK